MHAAYHSHDTTVQTSKLSDAQSVQSPFKAAILSDTVSGEPYRKSVRTMWGFSDPRGDAWGHHLAHACGKWRACTSFKDVLLLSAELVMCGQKAGIHQLCPRHA